ELKTNTEKSIDNIKQQEESDTQEYNFQDNNINNKTNWQKINLGHGHASSPKGMPLSCDVQNYFSACDDTNTTDLEPKDGPKYKKQKELKTESQSQKEPKIQMQFSPENPYVSEMVLESTDKSFTETQEILQLVTETTMTETIQTEEFNLTEAIAETNEMKITETKLEATNISTNEDLATDMETDFISHKEMNNNDKKEFTLVT
ncbi:32319_t:CDS:2, partial [Racocetra persica]